MDPITNNTIEQTTISQTSLDLDSWLMDTPVENKQDTPQPSTTFFKKDQTDLSFIDNIGTEPQDLTEEQKKDQEIKDTINNITSTDTTEIPEEKSPVTGRPKSNKDELISFLKEQIEAGEMVTFDDYNESEKSLDDYLNNLPLKEVKDLYKANQTRYKDKLTEDLPQQFYNSLPEEFQQAYEYFRQGGRDIKGILSHLSKSHEIKTMDTATSAEEIVTEFLRAKNFPEEDIKNQVQEWQELGSIEKKAEQYKPILEQMNEQEVQKQIFQQQMLRQQQDKAAQDYVNNVFEALRPGELSGIKLDRKTQEDLYRGLTEAAYPSISGRQTNLLGHLIEKYQFTEPDPGLIAEVLWHLNDPKGFKDKLKSQGEIQAVSETVKRLKTAEQSKNNTTASAESEYQSNRIIRPKNIFQR